MGGGGLCPAELRVSWVGNSVGGGVFAELWVVLGGGQCGEGGGVALLCRLSCEGSSVGGWCGFALEN